MSVCLYTAFRTVAGRLAAVPRPCEGDINDIAAWTVAAELARANEARTDSSRAARRQRRRLRGRESGADTARSARRREQVEAREDRGVAGLIAGSEQRFEEHSEI